MQVFLLAFCFVLVNSNQEEMRPCQTPSWEGRATANDYGLGKRTEFWIHYDKTNRRKKVLMESYTPHKQSIEMILLYDDKSYFKINHQTKECMSFTKPPVPWTFLQIPPNATFKSINWYGSAKHGLHASVWTSLIYMEDIMYTMPVWWQGVYSVQHCLPIREIFRSGSLRATVTSFMNVTIGIKDPHVFDPPPFCKRWRSE